MARPFAFLGSLQISGFEQGDTPPGSFDCPGLQLHHVRLSVRDWVRPVRSPPTTHPGSHRKALPSACRRQARQQVELRNDVMAGDLIFPQHVPQLNTRRAGGLPSDGCRAEWAEGGGLFRLWAGGVAAFGCGSRLGRLLRSGWARGGPSKGGNVDPY